MSMLSTVLRVVVLLCSLAGLQAAGCGWLRLYGDLSNDSLSLLDQMVRTLLTLITDFTT